MVELPVITRSCGGCTACCKTHIDDSMKIAGGDYCDHCQIGKGCSIYEKRPFACQVYRCLWVCGKGEEDDRPDRLNVVMDLKAVNFQGRDIVVVNFWEVEYGSTDQSRVQEIAIANINAGNVVVFREYEGGEQYHFPKGMFSPDEQQEFIEVLKRTPGALGV